MLIKNAVLTLCAAAGLTVSVAALAQPFEGPPSRHGFGEILRGVQLTTAQQQQVHALMKAAHTQNASAMTQMHALEEQIAATLLSPGTVTAAQLVPLEQQQETLRQQLDASRLQTALAIRNLLTSAQLTQASTMHSQLAALHQQERALVKSGQAAGPGPD